MRDLFCFRMHDSIGVPTRIPSLVCSRFHEIWGRVHNLQEKKYERYQNLLLIVQEELLYIEGGPILADEPASMPKLRNARHLSDCLAIHQIQVKEMIHIIKEFPPFRHSFKEYSPYYLSCSNIEAARM